MASPISAEPRPLCSCRRKWEVLRAGPRSPPPPAPPAQVRPVPPPLPSPGRGARGVCGVGARAVGCDVGAGAEVGGVEGAGRMRAGVLA